MNDLPPLANASGATVRLVPQLAMSGATVIVVIVKQRFRVGLDGSVTPVEGAEVRMADEPWDEDEPETSSVKYPSDVCIRKPSTDVVVVGSAMAPGKAAVKSLDVLVRVGSVEQLLRVFGTRVWYRGVSGLALGPPQPLRELPLRWEYAHGGFDGSDPRRPLEEPRNPVGRGVARDPDRLVGQVGPAIEDLHELLAAPGTPPAPAGLGALGRHWEPRRRWAGTMDERWKKERMPLPPLDFDERYNQVATPKLVTPAPLRGGEPVAVANACAEGPLQFSLPRLAFFVGARTAAGVVEHRPMLDTVLLEPNERRLELTWRSAVPLPRRASDLRGIQVHEKEVR